MQVNDPKLIKKLRSIKKFENSNLIIDWLEKQDSKTFQLYKMIMELDIPMEHIIRFDTHLQDNYYENKYHVTINGKTLILEWDQLKHFMDSGIFSSGVVDNFELYTYPIYPVREDTFLDKIKAKLKL